MTVPVILGYDYGLLLELVALGYVENALQKANPYKKNLQIWKETGLTFIDPITRATQSLPCNENFYVELSEISKKPGSSNVAVWPIGWDWGRLDSYLVAIDVSLRWEKIGSSGIPSHGFPVPQPTWHRNLLSLLSLQNT